MNILVACEFSGIVREAFKKQGHNAWSCDLLPTEIPGNHYQCNVRDVMGMDWDMMIAFPPCRYLSNSGVRWLINNLERYNQMLDACQFFNTLLTADIPKIVVENSIQHGYARRFIPIYDQIIQPYQFGHGETKATCLWLKGLPLLIPTNIVEGREARVHKEPPSPDRWKNRSRTFQGIAQAMSTQWG